jgi:DtxR family Mn-dependent transcriptional regulator
MTELIDTTEMYLRTIYELEEEGVVAMRARIAERIGHTGPTVSGTIARMERDGLVRLTEDRHLELTDEGRTKAIGVMRKHRLAERLLTDVIGLDWARVHDEACRWEHVMSEEVERRLVEILDHPDVSPYGNPIPGLDQLGDTRGVEPFLAGVRALTDVLAQQGSGAGVSQPLKVVRLGEVLQTDIGRMSQFAAAGVKPGALVRARRDGDLVVVRSAGAGGGVLELDVDLARYIFVEAGAAEPTE